MAELTTSDYSRLLELPTELRFQVYRHLLPTIMMGAEYIDTDLRVQRNIRNRSFYQIEMMPVLTVTEELSFFQNLIGCCRQTHGDITSFIPSFKIDLSDSNFTIPSSWCALERAQPLPKVP